MWEGGNGGGAGRPAMGRKVVATTNSYGLSLILEERGALCRSFIQLVIIRYRNIIFTSRTPQVKNRQNLTTLWGICSGVRGRLYASN